MSAVRNPDHFHPGSGETRKQLGDRLAQKDAAEALRAKAEAAAEREGTRDAAVDYLLGDGPDGYPDLESTESYSKYADLFDSIMESAEAGDFTTNSRLDKPFSQEEILENTLAAFEIQRGEKTADYPPSVLFPRAGGLRGQMTALLGQMNPGSEPGPHAAMIEALAREKYNSLKNPEAASLVGVDSHFDDELIEDSGDAELESDPEALDIEPATEQSSEREPALNVEQEVESLHERQTGYIVEDLNNVTSKIAGLIDSDYEGALKGSKMSFRHALDGLDDIRGRLVRMSQDYPADAVTRAASDIVGEIHNIRTGVLRYGQEVEYSQRSLDGLYSSLDAIKNDANIIDTNANAALLENGFDAKYEGDDSASAVVDSVESGLLEVGESGVAPLDSLRETARDMQTVNAENANILNQVAGRLEDMVRRRNVNIYEMSMFLDQARNMIGRSGAGDLQVRASAALGSLADSARKVRGELGQR